METPRRILILFTLIVLTSNTWSTSLDDSANGDLSELFKNPNCTYYIRHHHILRSKIKIPDNCKLVFEGGSLKGDIFFCNTLLQGNVNLKGSTISGKLRNKRFDASWLCYRNGVSDDAQAINQILYVCDEVFFPKGVYKLESKYQASDLDKSIGYMIRCHIGINKSNKKLIGEKGTVFFTDQAWGIINIYTQPNKIGNSVSNIKLENITFKTTNTGEAFQEFIHVIKTVGVNGLIIKGCHIQDFWGDAICLSTYDDTSETGERTRNQNVRIVGNIIEGGQHHNNRNGISVVNGKNVLIKDNIIKNTSNPKMPGAIDIEPNNSAYTMENIIIEGNEISGSQGFGGGIQISSFKGGPAHNIRIKKNIISDCKNAGITIVLHTKGTTSGFEIENNFIAKDTKPFSFVGKGSSNNWKIRGNRIEGALSQKIPGDFQIANLVVKNNK